MEEGLKCDEGLSVNLKSLSVEYRIDIQQNTEPNTDVQLSIDVQPNLLFAFPTFVGPKIHPTTPSPTFLIRLLEVDKMFTKILTLP